MKAGRIEGEASSILVILTHPRTSFLGHGVRLSGNAGTPEVNSSVVPVSSLVDREVEAVGNINCLKIYL